MSQSPETLTQNKVRNLIFAYENQASVNLDDSFKEPEHKTEVIRSRAKSIGNLFSFSKLFWKSQTEINSIIDIEKELVKLDAHLHYYQIYDKETHVVFQEQLFNVLTSIVIIDSRSDESVSQKKKELVSEVQRLVSVLNLKLPFGAQKNEETHGYRVYTQKAKYRVNTPDIQKYDSTSINAELVQTTTATESKEIKSSEGYSPIVVKSPDLQDVEPILIPSVSLLKQRFQKEVTTVESNATQVKRSQSMKVPSKPYRFEVKTLTQLKTTDDIPEEKSMIIEEIKENGEKEEAISENSTREADVGSISVHRLRSLFEVNSKENFEGLGLLSKNGPVFGKGTDIIPYTSMNLGAFRLKRTISGNYLNNCIGLLRSSSKSKSMGNLYDAQNSVVETVDIDIDVQDIDANGKGLIMTTSAVPIELYDNTEGNLEKTPSENLVVVTSPSNNEEESKGHSLDHIEDVSGNVSIVEESSVPTSYSTISTVSSGGNGVEESVHSATYSSSSRSYQSSQVYQEKRTVTSSSSTKHVTQSVQITESPVSYSTITYSNGQKVASLSSNNGVNSKNGNDRTTIEDVTEEYLEHADVPQNVDEEFNKLVEASDIQIEPY